MRPAHAPTIAAVEEDMAEVEKMAVEEDMAAEKAGVEEDMVVAAAEEAEVVTDEVEKQQKTLPIP
jgi:hypothetical protein